MTEGQQKITVALCAGMVAHAALEFMASNPGMWGLQKRDLLEKLQLLMDAVDGKDVANGRRPK